MLEHFQTDTADYADFVLPATTQAEHWDLQRMYGHHYMALNRPAIWPVGEARPNSAIFRGLAQAMGYTDSGFYEDDETILRNFVEAQRHPLYASVTWEALLEKGFVRLNLPQPYLPFADGNFPTPSGKCEFYSERMAQDGYDPLPTYTPPKSEAKGEERGASSEERAVRSERTAARQRGAIFSRWPVFRRRRIRFSIRRSRIWSVFAGASRSRCCGSIPRTPPPAASRRAPGCAYGTSWAKSA